MFRPERLSSVSIICLRRDVDGVLEALNTFGEFHIEPVSQDRNESNPGPQIEQIEKLLVDLNELSAWLKTESSSFISMFRSEKPIKMPITAENWPALANKIGQEIGELQKETQALTTSIENLLEKKTELSHVHDMLTVMQCMEVDLAAVEELRAISIVVASVPTKNLADLDKALQGMPLIFHRCYLQKDTQFVCSAFASKHRQDIERILKTHHGEIFNVPSELPHDVSKALRKVESQLSEIDSKENFNENALRKIAQLNRTKLISLRETTQNILMLLQAEEKIFRSGRISTVNGFVPRRKFQDLRQKVHSSLHGNVLVLKNQVEANADPPTFIHNNRFVKPFEEITRLYGLPHYEEVDPTPMIAVTFPLIFGLMFGDVGHGLVLLLGGLLLGLLIKRQTAVKNICWIIAACGLGAIFAGLLFGEFFGTQLFAPLWFNPFDNVYSFLIFSLFVGVAQIISGLVIEMIDFLLRRNFVDTLLTSAPKIAFYAGSVYLVSTYQLNFGAWLAGPILFALAPFLVLVFGRTIVYQATRFQWRSVEIPQEPKSLGERFFESSDLVARLLSNTMSYTRILALLMAHWALILATYAISGLVGTGSFLNMIFAGVIVVVGNVFVIGLEGLIVFIHTLRLHFYEWFSKFYQGNGTPFSPFKQNFVYTELKLGEKEETAQS